MERKATSALSRPIAPMGRTSADSANYYRNTVIASPSPPERFDRRRVYQTGRESLATRVFYAVFGKPIILWQVVPALPYMERERNGRAIAFPTGKTCRLLRHPNVDEQCKYHEGLGSGSARC